MCKIKRYEWVSEQSWKHTAPPLPPAVVSQLHRCFCCTLLTPRTAASHQHAHFKGSRLKQTASNIVSSPTHRYLYTRDPSKAYFTRWQNIYCTQLHNISLSHTQAQTEMSCFAASVQLLNGPAVRVRLIVSQPTQSACISVYSHCPLDSTAGSFACSFLRRQTLQMNALFPKVRLMISRAKTKVPLCPCCSKKARQRMRGWECCFSRDG